MEKSRGIQSVPDFRDLRAKLYQWIEKTTRVRKGVGRIAHVTRAQEPLRIVLNYLLGNLRSSGRGHVGPRIMEASAWFTDTLYRQRYIASMTTPNRIGRVGSGWHDHQRGRRRGCRHIQRNVLFPHTILINHNCRKCAT